MLARSHHIGYNSTTCDRCKPGWPPNVQKAHKRGCSDAGIAPYPDSSVVAHSTHSPLLVLAVTTTATKKALGMRAEIRRGWDMMVTPGFVGRFAFGVHNHSATAAALAGEHATHRDLLFVAQSVSANGNARETVLGWWRVAAGLFPRARFLAKADDDCFVHLPRLLAHVEKLAGCHPFLYMGSMIYGVREQPRLAQQRRHRPTTVVAGSIIAPYVRVDSDISGCALLDRWRRCGDPKQQINLRK